MIDIGHLGAAPDDIARSDATHCAIVTLTLRPLGTFLESVGRRT